MTEDYFDDNESSEESSVGNDVFDEAMERLQIAKDAFSDIHETYTDDVDFSLLGNQWPADTKSNRELEGRNTGVFNKIAPLIRNITNTSLKNSPAIKVSSRTNNDKTICKFYDGLVKFIESESNAPSVYNDTLKCAVAGGIGVFEIVVDDNDFDNVPEITITRITDPTSVYPDPESSQPDFSDAKWLFHIKKIGEETFKKMYPDADISELITKKDSAWYSDKCVTVAEYWVRKDDGSVCWYVLNGTEVIDASDWKKDEFENPTPYPGKYLPYCFITGEEVWLDGQRVLKSAVTDVREYQKTYNYMQAEAIDFIAKSAKTPWLASDASIEPYKKLWKNANTQNYPYLPYVEGKAVPQKNTPPVPPVGYIDSMSRLDQDIRTNIGIRDPLQDIPAGQSGKAIGLQISESNVNTYVWVDHLNRAIKRCGRIIVDLIPHYYNYPHQQPIISVDGSLGQMPVQTPFNDGGEIKTIDLSKADMFVTISTGASYETQKQETRDALLEMAKIDPRIMQVAGDIILRNMDFAESNEIADRLAAILPPQVAAIANQNNSELAMRTQLNQMNQAVQQSHQMIEKLTQTLNQKNQEVESLQSKNQADIVQNQQKLQADSEKAQLDAISKAQVAKTKADADVVSAQIKSQSDIRIAELEKEIEMIKLAQAQAQQTKVTIHQIPLI